VTIAHKPSFDIRISLYVYLAEFRTARSVVALPYRAVKCAQIR